MLHFQNKMILLFLTQQRLSIIAKQLCYEVKFTCKDMQHGPNIAQAFN